MKKIILFCLLILQTASPAFSEMITLQCDIKETVTHMTTGQKDSSTWSWHFVIDTTNKKVYYINGGIHQLFNSVDVSDQIIKTNSKKSVSLRMTGVS